MPSHIINFFIDNLLIHCEIALVNLMFTDLFHNEIAMNLNRFTKGHKWKVSV